MRAHARLDVTFRWVFLAACIGLLLVVVFLALMEEHPLRERASPKPGGAPAVGIRASAD